MNRGEWVKASRCGTSTCVQVRATSASGGVLVRDSKEISGRTMLHFTAAEWQAFTDGVKAGEFDL